MSVNELCRRSASLHRCARGLPAWLQEEGKKKRFPNLVTGAVKVAKVLRVYAVRAPNLFRFKLFEIIVLSARSDRK